MRRHRVRLLMLFLLLLAAVCVVGILIWSHRLAEPVTRLTEENDESYSNEVLERFRQRHAHVTSVCDAQGHVTQIPSCATKEARDNFNYVSDWELVFCTAEKTGSTFWKRVLHALTVGNSTADPLAIHIRDPTTVHKKTKGIQVLTNYSWTDIAEITSISRNVMYTRNPYTRLFSAWLDKFYSTNPYFWEELGKPIIKSLRKNATPHALKCGHDVTFVEFLEYILRKLRSRDCVNGHFSPVFHHCLPCNVSFDYIGKYETFQEDTHVLIKHLKLDGKVTMPNLAGGQVRDALLDASSWVFSKKRELLSCITFQCGLFRVWRRLQGRGMINRTAEFPYTTKQKADKLTEHEFLNTLLGVALPSVKATEEGGRHLAMMEAYSSVPAQLTTKLVEAFKLDFEVFGYDTRPPLQEKKSDVSSRLQFTEQCPY